MTAPATPRFSTQDVRRYYDRHTSAFLALGQGGNAGAIHRAVWGPGVRDRDEAFHHVENRIADILASIDTGADTQHVVDLGCGVGSSACYLAGRLRVRATGITLSPAQARIAAERIVAAGLEDRVVCREGDYTDLPNDIEPADLAYAIESFVHGPAPDRFFDQCRRLLKPGGVLVICDDFARPTRDPRAARALDRFQAGWHINALLQPDALHALARDAGFELESTVDLTPYLELRRLRDRMIALIVPVLESLPLDARRFDHLSGGSALQTCLANGWIGYDFVRFRRV